MSSSIMVPKAEVVNRRLLKKKSFERTTHRPHHQHQRGGTTARLMREVGKMAENMRNITQQNAIMQQLLMQIHGKA